MSDSNVPFDLTDKQAKEAADWLGWPMGDVRREYKRWRNPGDPKFHVEPETYEEDVILRLDQEAMLNAVLPILRGERLPQLARFPPVE